MPLFGDLVRDWQRGAQAVERGDWGCALRLFSGIRDPPAKICFNVGCVHLLAGDPEAALRAFDLALTKDVCVAVGFFQRGATNFRLERFREALSDFREALSDFRLALAQLRGNGAVDYTQLGLRFKLQAWEVLFNVAAAQCGLGLWAEATRSLEEAIAEGPEGACDLNTALGHVQVRAWSDAQVPTGQTSLQKQASLQPWWVPRGEVFWPHRRHLEHLAPMEFLGKAKVVAASAVPGDQHRGVRPPQLQALCEDGGAGPGAGPRTPPGTEAEVSFGQAEQAEPCVPAAYDKQGSPTEHAGEQAPPGLPAAGGPDPEPSEDCPSGGVSPGGSEPPLVTFTLAPRAPRGAAPPTLWALRSQALPLQAERGQLSYRDPGSGHWVPLPEEGALQTAWWESASGPAGLRPQCWGAGGWPVLYQVVAQHGYSAQGPEDLDLQPGNIVDVLRDVDQAWLEGHCDGLFPKCFVAPARLQAQRGQP